MKPSNKAIMAIMFGIAAASVSAVCVRFQFWMPATFLGLLAIYFFLLMAARIVRGGE